VRLFVAAYPPVAACDDLAARLAGLRVTGAAERGVNTRLARRETWHLTLAFLGEVPDDRAARAAPALKRVAAAWRADPPRLRLAGGGRFGRGRFTVLWVGVSGDEQALARLARLIRRELKRDRLPCDDRPFKAHLTVARPGDRIVRADVDADRDDLAGYAGPQWPLDRFELVRSHLGPTPTYDHLAAFALPSPPAR
jgi:RNA 2',3'-cyclic 3'-phosphodiesterase